MKITNKVENLDKKTKQDVEELYQDYLGSNHTHDGLESNLQNVTDLMEVLLWGMHYMRDQGVLTDEHTEAVVTYWQSEAFGKYKKAAMLIKKLRPVLNGRK